MSILFADLVGFTALSSDADPELTRELLTRYFDLCRDVIGRHGGIVEKFIGDAVMAVWGAPVAREDDAERAVRAGLELVGAIRTLGPDIQARAGVLTGEAAVTLGATNQGMVAGDLVNTASRIQSVAAPGTVLVGEATFQAASRAIVFEPAGEHTLKGKPSPVPAWRAVRVVAERGGRNRSGSLEAPFVGRDDELRQLKELFHATSRDRRARLVSVIGPAGIGKTRLAWEFLKYIDGLVENVLWHDGRSPAYGDGITFWALGEMVRGRASLLETDDEPTTREKIAVTLATHVPDAEERRWIESALLTLLGVESTAPSDQLFAAWRTFFERLTATAPVVMVFEDFHFADPGLVDFVDHLLEWSRNVPIYVLTLARPEFLEKRVDWATGKRNFTSLHLDPLSDASMRALLDGLVPGLPDSAIRSIVGRADGIPLYAVETVRMLLADGRLTLDGDAYRPTGDLNTLAVPATLTALIASRLDGLAPEDRALVSDAAVLGQSFTVTGLAAVAGIPEATLKARLDALVRRELLTLDADPRSPERGQYAFVQALIREVAYNTLARADRKARHLAAARYFEQLGSDELAGALAGHYVEAQRNAAEGEEADALAAQARVSLRAAAERAAALGSHAQAVAFYDQALELTTEPADEAALHELAGTSSSFLEHVDEAERHFRAAIATLTAAGDRSGAARATTSLGGALLSAYRLDAGLAVLETGSKTFGDLQDDEALVRLDGQLARAYMLLGDASRAVPVADRVLASAERLDLVDVVADTLVTRGTALGILGRPLEGIGAVETAHRLAVAHSLEGSLGRALTNLTTMLVYRDPRAGLEAARDGIAHFRRRGERRFQIISNACILARRTGDWDWAEGELVPLVGEDVGPLTRSTALSELILLRAFRGEPVASLIDDLEVLMRSGRTDPGDNSMLIATAAVAHAAGQHDAAREGWLQVAQIESQDEPDAFLLAARCSLLAGDSRQASEDLARAERCGRRGRAIATDVATVRAGIAALEGRSGEALATYRDALFAWRDLGLPWDEALCAIDAATLLDPDDPEIRAAADSAREILIRLRATPFLERLEAAMSRGTSQPGTLPTRDATAQVPSG